MSHAKTIRIINDKDRTSDQEGLLDIHRSRVAREKSCRRIDVTSRSSSGFPGVGRCSSRDGESFLEIGAIGLKHDIVIILGHVRGAAMLVQEFKFNTSNRKLSDMAHELMEQYVKSLNDAENRVRKADEPQYPEAHFTQLSAFMPYYHRDTRVKKKDGRTLIERSFDSKLNDECIRQIDFICAIILEKSYTRLKYLSPPVRYFAWPVDLEGGSETNVIYSKITDKGRRVYLNGVCVRHGENLNDERFEDESKNTREENARGGTRRR